MTLASPVLAALNGIVASKGNRVTKALVDKDTELDIEIRLE